MILVNYSPVPDESNPPPWTYTEEELISWFHEVFQEGYKKDVPPLSVEEVLAKLHDLGYETTVFAPKEPRYLNVSYSAGVLVDLNDYDVKWSDVDSYWVKWGCLYVLLKDGTEVELGDIGPIDDVDYKRPDEITELDEHYNETRSHCGWLACPRGE